MRDRHPLIIRVAGPLLGLFVVASDATAVNVALPNIQADLDTSLGTLQWTLSAYFLAIAVTVITVARMGDLFGRRRVFLLGLVVFGLGSALCAVSVDDVMLILSRVVQGVGGAALYSLSLALTSAAVPRDQIGRGVAAWAATGGFAMAISPVLAGGLIEVFDWRAVFVLNIPIVAFSAFMTLRLLEESVDPEAERRIDTAGIALLTTGLLVLMLGLIQADSWGWGSPLTIGLIIGSIVPLAAFLVVESRVSAPLIELGIFLRNLPFLGANVLALAAYYAVYVFLFIAALYLQNIHGDSALGAGIRLLPFAIVFAALAPKVGGIVNRIGPVIPMVIGGSLLAGSLLALSFADADSPELFLFICFAVFGAGMAVGLVSISAAALGAVPTAKIGAASGIRSTMAYVGGALGVAVAGAVLLLRERSRLSEITAAQGRELSPTEQRDIDALLSGSPEARAQIDLLTPLEANEVIAAAGEAFTAGMATTLRLTAGLLVVCTVAMLVLTRWRTSHRDPAPHGHAMLPPPEEAHTRARESR